MFHCCDSELASVLIHLQTGKFGFHQLLCFEYFNFVDNGGGGGCLHAWKWQKKPNPKAPKSQFHDCYLLEQRASWQHQLHFHFWLLLETHPAQLSVWFRTLICPVVLCHPFNSKSIHEQKLQMQRPPFMFVHVYTDDVHHLHGLKSMHSKQQLEGKLPRSNALRQLLIVPRKRRNERLIQLSITRLGMTVWCCLCCLASSNSCPINLHQSRQTESEKWRRPACANINPKFSASVPSWPWFGMTSICWLAAHISLQIVWARLICFYARLAQNVMPRYLLGELPMWCRVASDRQEGEKEKKVIEDDCLAARADIWKAEARWTHPGTVSQRIWVLLGETKVE